MLFWRYCIESKVAFSYIRSNPINSDQTVAKIVLFILNAGLIILFFNNFLFFAFLVFKHLNESEVINLKSSEAPNVFN